MSYEQKMFKQFCLAMVCVALLLVLMLVTALVVNHMIAPLLVSTSLKLREVDWVQIKPLAQIFGFVLGGIIFCIVMCFIFAIAKALK
jgi:hypothetical protein